MSYCLWKTISLITWWLDFVGQVRSATLFFDWQSLMLGPQGKICCDASCMMQRQNTWIKPFDLVIRFSFGWKISRDLICQSQLMLAKTDENWTICLKALFRRLILKVHVFRHCILRRNSTSCVQCGKSLDKNLKTDVCFMFSDILITFQVLKNDVGFFLLNDMQTRPDTADKENGFF